MKRKIAFHNAVAAYFLTLRDRLSFHSTEKRCRKALFAGLALSVLLTPTRALSAEREGTVLFFSVEDPQRALSHPALPSLSHRSPSDAWWEPPGAAEQDGPVERNFRWGNGLGVEGYTRSGTRPYGATKV
jgi:hypothetical protein